MLTFQQGPRPRNFLSRREQWRLLLLVFTLGLVVVLMFEARKPEYYLWMWAGEKEASNSAAAEGVAADTRPIDTRVSPRPLANTIPGAFISPAPSKPEKAESARYFPGVEESRLGSIRDNAPLRRAEWDVWLHLFDVLKKNNEEALRQASVGRVSFVQLFEQSAEYRGELVSTSGTVRRAHQTTAPKNDYGITEYYQVWLQPADRLRDPITVWCLDLPEGFPTGMEIAEEAEITGFYFKLLAYKAGDDSILRAPMLLARTVDWRKRPAPVAKADHAVPTLLLLFGGAIVFAGLVICYVYCRTRSTGPTKQQLTARFSPASETPPDVGAVLERLDKARTHDSS